MTVHGYVRASTSLQKESPKVQQDIIRQYCRAQRLTPPRVVYGDPGQTINLGETHDDPLWYIDPATSAKVLLRDRDAGKVLCQSLHKGDHIVIAKLDRAFRRLSDCAVMLDEFRRMDVHLHVCNLMGGAIDLSSPIGVFLIQLLAAFAELERAFIAERIGEGIRAKKRQGIACGHARYGFKLEPQYLDVNGVQKRYLVEVPDEYERSIMKMLLRWRMSDPPWTTYQMWFQLARVLKLKTTDGREWSHDRINRAIKAETILQFQEVTSGRCTTESH